MNLSPISYLKCGEPSQPLGEEEDGAGQLGGGLVQDIVDVIDLQVGDLKEKKIFTKGCWFCFCVCTGPAEISLRRERERQPTSLSKRADKAKKLSREKWPVRNMELKAACFSMASAKSFLAREGK